MDESYHSRIVALFLMETMDSSASPEVTALIEQWGLRLSQNYGLPRLVRDESACGLQDAP